MIKVWKPWTFGFTRECNKTRHIFFCDAVFASKSEVKVKGGQSLVIFCYYDSNQWFECLRKDENPSAHLQLR